MFLKRDLGFSCKVKHTHSLWAVILLWDIYSREVKTCLHKNFYKKKFIATFFFIIAQIGNNSDVQQQECTRIQWDTTHNERSIIRNIMLSARSYKQNGTYCMFPLLHEILGQAKLINGEKNRAVVGVRGELTVKAQEETFWGNGTVLCLDKDLGYQIYAFIKTHQTICIIPVHFTIYKDKSIKREEGET